MQSQQWIILQLLMIFKFNNLSSLFFSPVIFPWKGPDPVGFCLLRRYILLFILDF